MTRVRKCTLPNNWRLLATFLLVVFNLPATQSAFAKTDVVVFENGDRLTGELKSLNRGQVKFKTDPTGTINIEWDKVAFIKVDQHVQVETQNGERFFGLIEMTEETFVVRVATENGSMDLDNDFVVQMTPIDQTGLSDIDLSIAAGYNFTKASDVTQFNVGADASYRTRRRILSGQFSSLISNSANNDPSQRQSLSINYTTLRSNRWLNDGGVSFDRNDELGLNLRTSLSAGGGRILIQSNQSNLILKGGLKATRENNANQVEDLDSLEAYGTVGWEWFRYDSPELDWSTSLEIIPSLTEAGRVRSEFDTTLRWELLDDFYWQLSLYDSYDNQTQSETASQNDYGITTSVSYDF